ncbi:MAG TPA: glycosyltransferase [Epsilonproteobacteria bacterium]|nr:glycosyltransferase [Campylobacterota bacterium]
MRVIAVKDRKSHTLVLALVVPCYNEEEVLKETIRQLSAELKQLIHDEKISPKSFVKFVDDGSRDQTWDIIDSNAQENPLVKGLKLSKNEGHQNALLAGMASVEGKCDCMVSLDADLQQDPKAIARMLVKYHEGYEIVLGVRSDRASDTVFKKMTAEGYYRVMQLMGVELQFNHADYRLMSQRAVVFFLQFKERNLFIRGIVKLIGLKTTTVSFTSGERFAGESKYPLKKMLSFAWDGITSFSVLPLKFIMWTGFIIFVLSIVIGIHSLYIVLFTDEAVPGWASTVLPMYFMGGVQLLAIGILGEYIGKIYKETKGRPRFFVEEEIE